MVCGLLGLCTGLEDKVHHTAPLPVKVAPTGPYCALAVGSRIDNLCCKFVLQICVYLSMPNGKC